MSTEAEPKLRIVYENPNPKKPDEVSREDIIKDAVTKAYLAMGPREREPFLIVDLPRYLDEINDEEERQAVNEAHRLLFQHRWARGKAQKALKNYYTLTLADESKPYSLKLYIFRSVAAYRRHLPEICPDLEKISYRLKRINLSPKLNLSATG